MHHQRIPATIDKTRPSGLLAFLQDGEPLTKHNRATTFSDMETGDNITHTQMPRPSLGVNDAPLPEEKNTFAGAITTDGPESMGEDKPIGREFDEYTHSPEPDKKEKSENWGAAIGLQQVDGLTPSDYLIKTAKRNIEGDITIPQVRELLKAYYTAKPQDPRTEEADKVSANIAEILSESTFNPSPVQYTDIHKRLFHDVFHHAGKIRDYDITKKEWVLNGDTVIYTSAPIIEKTLDYDFSREQKFSYKPLTLAQTARHIAAFLAGIWQIHPFGEGNTRATAVFAIKYLRTMGFKVENKMFAEHSWYFRNALVRANYKNIPNGIHETFEYLDMFLGNLLLGQHNVLKNRELLAIQKPSVR